MDERGVHIETDKSAHATEHVVALEGEVDLHLRGEFHQLRLQLLTIGWLTTQRELDTGTGVLTWVLDALTARKSQDGVDVEALIGKDARGAFNMTGLELATHHHEDITVLALMAHPVFVLIVGDGREADVDIEFRGLEEQFLHDLTRVGLVHADEDAQRERRVDIGLTNIEDLCIVLGENAHNRGRQSRTVLPRNPY